MIYMLYNKKLFQANKINHRSVGPDVNVYLESDESFGGKNSLIQMFLSF